MKPLRGFVMGDALADQLALLPEYLGKHLLLSAIALLIGIGISLPLSILTIRVRVLRAPVLALASSVQTVPSLALLALMVPLLRAIGFLPAVIALILYSMLPVIRNTVTGIEDVDPDLIEAGRGVGMTSNQLLFKVQIPLALPVIIAGIRTATVWVVGIATLSTPVGATSLGNYIFSGLQTQNYTAVTIGCVAAAVLALLLDLLIRLMEMAAMRRSRPLAVFASALVGLVLMGGLVPMLLDANSNGARPRIVVGAKTFTEQYILAEVMARQLEKAGFYAEQLESLGSTVVFDALASGDIDCYVDYSGTIWANYMKRDDNPGPWRVLEEVTHWLQQEYGIVCLGPLGFENAYALAMRRDLAEELGVQTIDDLRMHAQSMTIGGDYEFFGRPEWTALVNAYVLSFADTVSMDSTLMYEALDAGQVDVISAFSSDGRIVAFDLVVLDDPRDALPPYDAVLLLGSAAADHPHVVEALQPMIDAIDDDAMRRANKLVDVDRQSVAAAAEALTLQMIGK